MCTIGTLHASNLLPDCHVTDSNVGESKTTVTVDTVLADQSERKNTTNLGRKIRLDDAINSNRKGEHHTLTSSNPSTQPEEVA